MLGELRRDAESMAHPGAEVQRTGKQLEKSAQENLGWVKHASSCATVAEETLPVVSKASLSKPYASDPALRFARLLAELSFSLSQQLFRCLQLPP